jgi:Putative prokaryotic signal transducing protein
MNFKQIAAFDNYFFANIAMGMLQENNINCHLKDEHIVSVDPLLSNAVGGIKLMVHDAQIERALLLLKKAESVYLKQIICPVCKKEGLSVEEKITNNPSSFWGKIKNQLLYGTTILETKKYICANCFSVFTSLPNQ